MATNNEKTQVTIIGLGLVGASAGLALKRYTDRVVVVGHDKDKDVSNRAKSMGAVDRTEWNLVNAIRGADRILLAVPAPEVRDTLGYIKQDLKPRAVIVDTSSIKAPVLAWAKEILPPEASFVGGHPILLAETQDTSVARADLFQDKIFCLTTDTRTSPEALHLATDLVEALGAKAFFIDPFEHDGLSAAVEHLPMLLAGALARAASESSSWQEMRKVAASQFYTSTYIVEPDAQAAAEACLANSRNTIRWIDNLVAELGQWRQRLEAGDQAGLTENFEQARQAIHGWTRAQATGDWSEAPPAEIPNMSTQMRRMFGFGGRDFRNPPKSNKGK